MFVLGITGGIGTGKTTVADIFMSRGVFVLDADSISRDVTDIDGSALPEIIELLGHKAIDSTGKLNRRYVASLVFSDRTKLDYLSAIIHRFVLEKMSQVIVEEKEKGTKLVVLDVPVPVKKGFLDICDQVWVIQASTQMRIERLLHRGMSQEDAQRRMDMQMTSEEYAALADIVIDNNGTKEELERVVNSHIEQELHERGIRI